MVNHITYKLVDRDSYQRVLCWLQKPHVNAFFYGQGLQNTLLDLEKQVFLKTPLHKHWIASYDTIEFGYLITSDVEPQNKEDSRFAKYIKAKETAITLDLLIGEEEYLGQGLAKKMIQNFLLSAFSHTNKVFIDPECTNTRAIHVYEKAGFQKLEKFIAQWHRVPHWLMKMEICDLKKNANTRKIFAEFDPNLSLTVTQDISLRTLKIEDSTTLFQLVDNNREYLRRFLGWLDHNRSEADTQTFINSEIEKLKCGKSLTLAICYRETFVGLLEFHEINQINHSASIGYWLDESHQGKGIMTRSIKALIQYGFATMNLHRIEIRCAVENKKSEQIPIRLGFKREGTLKEAEWHYGDYFDMNLFGLTSE